MLSVVKMEAKDSIEISITFRPKYTAAYCEIFEAREYEWGNVRYFLSEQTLGIISL